jgi:hypothetical protein
MILHTTRRKTPHQEPSLQDPLLKVALALLLLVSVAGTANAQYVPPPPPPPPTAEQTAPPPPPPGPLLGPKQLDKLVERIALYPDPLLAQILTASTYWNEIPEAAAWANQHSYLKGDALAQAIQADNLQWHPSVLALLPFPSVLNMMAADMAWTEQLGTAVLKQRPDVMDAIQRMRKKAYDFGYLRSNPYDVVVNTSGYIEIQPVNPAYIYLPVYNPAIVFAPPPPGFVISGAIHFGPAIVVGAAFAPWGWVHPGFLWGAHAIIIDRTPWNRFWFNRGVYVHPYVHPWVRAPGIRVERHVFPHR